MADDKNTKTTTTRTGRFMKLAGMTASVATRYAGERVKRVFGSAEEREARLSQTYDKMASDIVNTLGELKGAVMKVGQIASQTQDFLPPEFSKALQKLQKEAPPMPFQVIRDQIRRELGGEPQQVFQWFDEKPYAAASIGQVHRARLHNGQEVIVKVQYPGVDESCDSDLKQLRLALKLGGLLKIPKEMVDQLFEEIRIRLKEELDYENEARNIERFREFHREDQGVLIPAVIPEFSTRRVLTLELVEGDHISQVTSDRYSQDTINQIGHRIFTTMADQLFKFQCIHGDPHAGNFAYRPDGSIILYDFGCVKELKPEIVEAYRKSLIAALYEEYDALDRYMIELGVRVEDKPPIDSAYYAMWRDILIRPFASRDEAFNFAEADIHQQVAAKTPTIWKYMDRFRPPVESIFIDRMIAGHYWIMKKLGVQAAFRGELERYLGLDKAA